MEHLLDYLKIEKHRLLSRIGESEKNISTLRYNALLAIEEYKSAKRAIDYSVNLVNEIDDLEQNLSKVIGDTIQDAIMKQVNRSPFIPFASTKGVTLKKDTDENKL